MFPLTWDWSLAWWLPTPVVITMLIHYIYIVLVYYFFSHSIVHSGTVRRQQQNTYTQIIQFWLAFYPFNLIEKRRPTADCHRICVCVRAIPYNAINSLGHNIYTIWLFESLQCSWQCTEINEKKKKKCARKEIISFPVREWDWKK